MTKRRRGVSKAEWLEAALEALEAGGVGGVSIEGLARSLGISRAGFYWHFRDRSELLRELLDYWVHETTEVVSRNASLMELEPRRRLQAAAEQILDFDLARYDGAIRLWAQQDRVAARAVRKVNKLRSDFVGRAFRELGFRGDELESRTRLFVGYQSGEPLFFPELSRARRRALIRRRVALLTKR